MKNNSRLAKIISNSGVCSRRQAEVLITDGRVKVNNEAINSPVFNVTLTDSIEIDGKLLINNSTPRLWTYYKPNGLITTTHDPQGRPTIFENLKDLPRVISIGRLDLRSEGLLLLTNNGDLSRIFELPSSSIERVYKVRAYGDTKQILKFINIVGSFDVGTSNEESTPMSTGVAESDNVRNVKSFNYNKKYSYSITIDSITYNIKDIQLLGMKVDIDDTHTTNIKSIRSNKQNKWFEVSLLEGKNREIRKIFEYFGLQVNRLIRTKYGPFCLDGLKPGEYKEQPLKTFKPYLSSSKN